MPFWKKNNDRPSKREIENMQDAKISLAENLPAHVKIIDLSGIYLTELPYGIISIVKHQNKECLILKNNDIKDFKNDLNSLDELLKLDVSFNHFKSVPKSLASCQSLVHLNFDHNELKTLPAILGSLKNLETLSANSNNITSISPEIGALQKLQSLQIKDNQVTKIPDNFAHCYKLVNLEVDLEKLVYPPAEVIMQGGRATVLWLCSENNVDASKVDSSHDSQLTAFADISADERTAQELILQHEAIREKEAAEMMAKIREEEESMKKIATNTNAIEEKRLQRLQRKMEEEEKIERKKLSEYIKFKDDEKMANIAEALKECEDKDLDAERILREVEAMFEEEKRNLAVYIAEDEEILKKYVNSHELDMSFVAREMEKVLMEEQMMDRFVEMANKELEEMFSEVKREGEEENKVHSDMAKSEELDKGKMLDMIMEDEQLQRKMFVTAQQEQDKLYKTLSSQIESVQENLILLTILEKSQKEMDQQMVSDVSAQRSEMAGLLTQLMSKQEERRVELEEAAIQIENQYQDELANFWLYQYQMLMASKPAKILREEEEAMHAASKAMAIEKSDGADYAGPDVLPAAWRQPSAPVDDSAPSAPPADTPPADDVPGALSALPAPTAPPFRRQESSGVAQQMQSETECCICLDKVPNVAFLPCGHVCCCAECGIVTVCPMCRATITSTVKLYFTQTM